MGARQNSYLVSLAPLDTGSGASNGAVEFVHHNHDDIARIVAVAQASSGLSADSAAAMAVGLKLLSQTVLEHKDNPLFDGMRQPLREFIRMLKASAGTATDIRSGRPNSRCRKFVRPTSRCSRLASHASSPV